MTCPRGALSRDTVIRQPRRHLSRLKFWLFAAIACLAAPGALIVGAVDVTVVAMSLNSRNGRSSLATIGLTISPNDRLSVRQRSITARGGTCRGELVHAANPAEP